MENINILCLSGSDLGLRENLAGVLDTIGVNGFNSTENYFTHTSFYENYFKVSCISNNTQYNIDGFIVFKNSNIKEKLKGCEYHMLSVNDYIDKKVLAFAQTRLREPIGINIL